jgi:hypothetical protein
MQSAPNWALYACAMKPYTLTLTRKKGHIGMKTLYQISSGLNGMFVLRKRILEITFNPVKFTSALRTILVCIIFLLSSFKVPGGKPVMTEEMRFQTERAFFYYQIRDLPFSEDLLKLCIYYERIEYQDIVILQSQLETGYYTSDIFLNGNNCFGMRFPKRRPTVATGTYKEHAQYSHWSDSVIDYALWQKYYLSRGYRLEESNDDAFYLVFLNCVHYAADPRYVSKLVEMSQRDLT